MIELGAGIKILGRGQRLGTGLRPFLIGSGAQGSQALRSGAAGLNSKMRSVYTNDKSLGSEGKVTSQDGSRKTRRSRGRIMDQAVEASLIGLLTLTIQQACLGLDRLLWLINTSLNWPYLRCYFFQKKISFS